MGMIEGDHTLLAPRRARAVARGTTCDAPIGTRLADICRPSSFAASGAGGTDQRLRLPSDPVHPELELAPSRKHQGLADLISGGDEPSLTRRLVVAREIARRLDDLHAGYILHAGLSFDAVRVDGGSGEVDIVDLCDAVVLPLGASLPNEALRERGKVAFTPEGAVRSRQPIDHRCDLYRLGDLFFRLFTGRPAFDEADRAALAHAHLAAVPAPHDGAAWPSAVRRIVMALLEKRPERRYSSAADVASDLDRCIVALRHQGRIDDFSLRLEPLHVLLARGGVFHGRDDQFGRLVNGLARARRGRSESFLLVGGSGMGKSTLVQRFLASGLGENDIVGVGRFERSDADAPFGGVSRCLDGLVEHALAMADARPADVLTKITARLKDNIGVLAMVAPGLRRWLALDPPHATLEGAGALDRLAQAVLNLIACFESDGRATVLVFDDLQRADSASLDLIARLCGGARDGVVVVGTTRAGEGAEAGPAGAAAALAAGHGPPERLDLQPLNRSDIEDILAALYGTRARADEAADLIYAKTLGTPLYVCQFLSSLGGDALRDAGEAWDLRHIAGRAGAETIADFVGRRIGELPKLESTLLIAAAHLGIRFDGEELGAVAGIERASASEGLRRLVETGLIIGLGQEFSFVHDRIREAAYGLCDDHAGTHRRIARLLLARRRPRGPDPELFRLLAQFDAAGDLSAWPDLEGAHRDIVCEAALEAHRTAGFAIARACAARALDAARSGAWILEPGTRRDLVLVRAGSDLALGDHESFDASLDDDRRAMCADEDLLRFALLEHLSLHARGRYDDALDCGLGALRVIGVDLPADREGQALAVGREFARLQAALSERGPAALASLPALTDRPIALAMEILYRLAPNAHNTQRSELFALMALRNANLLLTHGRSEQASCIVMTLALTLSAMTGDVAFADGFAQAAMAMDAADGRHTPASVTFIYTYFFNHWFNPIETSLAINSEGARDAAEAGDAQFAAFHAAAYVIHLSATGAPLRTVARVGREHRSGAAGRISTSAFHCDLEVAFAEALLGLTAAPTSLERHRATSAGDVLARAEALAPSERGFFLARHLQLAFLFDRLLEAGLYADALHALMPAIAGNTVEFDVTVFSLLTAIARDERSERLDASLARLRRWSCLNLHDFGPRCDLVLACDAFREGRVKESIVLFDRAASGAWSRRQPHVVALANELAGRAWVSLGDRVAGLARLRAAVSSYEEWEARAKVTALRVRFPELSKVEAWGDLSDAARASIDGFAAVSSSARAISAEVDMNALAATIMDSARRLAGGNYAVLILRQGSEFHVEATSRHGQVVVGRGGTAEPLEQSRSVPVSVVHAVERSGTALVIDDALRSAFGADPYVRDRRVASALCVPLVGGGNLDGFIYVENDLAVGAFSESSSQALQVLAAQAAVALSNARLFGLLEGARAELAEANRSLERRIDARTRELALASDLALEKAAEADRARKAERGAHEAKSRFLAVVSHEIRTPLNGMLGMLQLLRRDRLADTERRQIDLAQRSGFGLVGLLDGILDLSRLETGTAASVHETFEVGQLLDGAVEIFRPAAEGKGLEFRVAVGAPGPVRLRGDAQGLARVLTNLVGNAVKFTPAGHVAVSLALDGAGAERSTLRIRVADTGIGVSPALQERIFEDFVQADPSVARRYGGSGLGLAICRGIVELLGGTIAIESRPGVGSTFLVDVPVDVDARPAPVPDAEPAAAGRRVLVVDDDEVNLEVAAGLLRRLGHEVACADCCTAALEAVENTRFDVVLLDLQMPDVDGLETAQRIRRACERGLPPFLLLLTADALMARPGSAVDDRVDGVVAKPVSARSLAEAIAALPERGPRGVDTSAFVDLCDLLDAGTIVDLIRRFARTARATRSSLAEAGARGDVSSVARLAHRFRSSAGSLHLVEVEGLAERIEAEAALGRVDLARLALLDGACPRAARAAIAVLRSSRAVARERSTLQPVGSTLTANL